VGRGFPCRYIQYDKVDEFGATEQDALKDASRIPSLIPPPKDREARSQDFGLNAAIPMELI